MQIPMSRYKPCFRGSELYALYSMPVREQIKADEIARAAFSWSGGKFAQINGPFRTSDEAFDAAGALVEMCQLERDLPPLSVIGDFVLPPLGAVILSALHSDVVSHFET
jgi:hypothetical protein